MKRNLTLLLSIFILGSFSSDLFAQCNLPPTTPITIACGIGGFDAGSLTGTTAVVPENGSNPDPMVSGNTTGAGIVTEYILLDLGNCVIDPDDATNNGYAILGNNTTGIFFPASYPSLTCDGSYAVMSTTYDLVAVQQNIDDLLNNSVILSSCCDLVTAVIGLTENVCTTLNNAGITSGASVQSFTQVIALANAFGNPATMEAVINVLNTVNGTSTCVGTDICFDISSNAITYNIEACAADCSTLVAGASVTCDAVNGGQGTLAVNSTGGTSPYTYSGDADGSVIIDGAAWTVTVTDTNGCMATEMGTVNCPLVFDCPTEMTNFGDSCDDGDANTGNDTVQSDCSCAGQALDCLGVPGGTDVVGATCDDMDATTGNDVYQADCTCAGEALDCLNVPGGTDVVGAACDDGDPNTSGDVYQADCSCAGTSAFDCPAAMANIGDTCDDGNANTGNDTIQADCSCAGLALDCLGVAGGTAVPGSTCDDGNATTANDIYQGDCTCAGTSIFDCPAAMANIGDTCDDGNVNTGNDTIQADCSCAGLALDCLGVAGGTAVPGAACDDGDATTMGDVYLADCTCAGNVTFDCPAISLNVGDPCDDGDANTSGDAVLADCSCAGTSIFDCPAAMANIGDTCDDGDAATTSDVILADCSCAGTAPTFDCPAAMANIGDTCDDGDANTTSDVILADCSCAGTAPTFDCPAAMANIGDTCDDGDAATTGDVILADCSCAGTAANDPIIAPNVDDPCSCGNPNNVEVGGTLYVEEIVTIEGAAGATWTVDYTTSTGMYDNAGNLLDDSSSIVFVEASAGVYTLTFWHEENVGFSGVFNDGTFTLMQANTCSDCPEPTDCPALGLNIGDTCDDGDAGTENDAVQADCSCAGTLIPVGCGLTLTIDNESCDQDAGEATYTIAVGGDATTGYIINGTNVLNLPVFGGTTFTVTLSDGTLGPNYTAEDPDDDTCVADLLLDDVLCSKECDLELSVSAEDCDEDAGQATYTILVAGDAATEYNVNGTDVLNLGVFGGQTFTVTLADGTIAPNYTAVDPADDACTASIDLDDVLLF